MKYTFLILFVYILSSTAEENTSDRNEMDVFVPTKEWKVVKKGQPIPKGLHVRINFETGVTEAKVADSENDESALSVIPEHTASPEDHSPLSPETIKEALQNIKADDIKDPDIEKVKHKYRTYEQIKLDFEEMNVKVQSDAEILTDLFRRYGHVAREVSHGNTSRKSEAKLELLAIITDLEYLVHQIDNANDFVRLKGLEVIILPNLINQTDFEIKSEILKLLTSCIQNNFKTKIAALHTGIGNALLSAVSTERNIVKSHAIIALGALTRGYPYAQQQLISKAGADILLTILNDPKSDISLQIKIVTLIQDLFLEYVSAKNDNFNTPLLKEYKNVNIEKFIQELDFCTSLITLLVNDYKYFPDDHDNLHKILNAIGTVASICRENYLENNEFIQTLIKLGNIYSKLSIEELKESPDEDSFFASMLQILNAILKNIIIKDEL